MSRNSTENLDPPVEVRLARNSGGILPLAGRIGPQKTRTKMFLVFAALMTALFVLLTAHFLGRLQSWAQRDIEASVADAARVASLDLALSLERDLHGDRTSQLAAVFESSPGLVYAVLEDEAGRVLVSVDPDRRAGSSYRNTALTPSLKDARSVFRTSVPLVAGDRASGRLYFGFSFPERLEALAQERRLAIAAGLLILAVGLAFVFLVSSQVTRPMVQVARTAERIAHGDLTQRVRIYSRDEAGLLAKAFNAMMDGLERSCRDMEARASSLEERSSSQSFELEREILERRRIEQELRLVREELEARVEERTEELSQVNEELHGKVRERKRAEDQLQNTLERLERALEGTVKAWSMTGEMRDFTTAGHQRRVSSLAVAIAEELHLPWEKVEGLRIAGIIHDIGKIAMPAEILAKPARLTKTEFQLVKDHPRIGFEIVKSIDFPWPVAHIILQHHERMDGSGYPEGLLGDAILLEARILAVADVVEALSSHRPYRPAHGIEKALEEIRRGRGIRYDMRVVDTCIKLFRERHFSFPAAAAGASLHS
jgi:putative nucleotidyltransferase with HDIG domain